MAKRRKFTPEFKAEVVLEVLLAHLLLVYYIRT